MYNLKRDVFNKTEVILHEHSPPKIVCNTDTNPQALTSPRGSTVMVIAGGNALGNSIPPYYEFPGQRWNKTFLDGATTGTRGKMS